MKVRKKVVHNFVKVTAALTTEWRVIPGEGDVGDDPRCIGDRDSNMLTEKHEMTFLRN
jgi:hypothetical protein